MAGRNKAEAKPLRTTDFLEATKLLRTGIRPSSSLQAAGHLLKEKLNSET